MWTEDNLMVLLPEDQHERDGFVPLAESSNTVGGWGVILVRATQGSSGVTHLHRGESEAFLILEGDVEVCGARSVTPLVPGSFVLVPPDTEHALRVVSAEARWLAIWPAALDGVIDELSRAKAQGRDDPDTIAEIRHRHGVESGGPLPGAR
jgi:quercetin dioxygenase-like cupin family protein